MNRSPASPKMRQYLDGRTMDDVAIGRLQQFEAEALDMHADGYYLAYSGGKDSDVILHLAHRAGVRFSAHHNLTTADAPETVYHVRAHAEVAIEKPKLSMWALIRKKGQPPRRTSRYCCESQKERGGAGRFVVLGLRWQESGRRTKRRLVEACYKDRTKRFLSPIIDWTTADVWEYIHSNHISYNPLYDEGFKRVGCVLCPMSRDVARDLARFPRICAAWERAVKATWNRGDERWPTREAYWQWWLDRDAPSSSDPSPVLFEDDPGIGTGPEATT